MAEVAGSNPASPTRIFLQTSACTPWAAPCAARNPQVPIMYIAVPALRATRPKAHLRNPERKFGIGAEWTSDILSAVRCLKSSSLSTLRFLRCARHHRKRLRNPEKKIRHRGRTDQATSSLRRRALLGILRCRSTRLVRGPAVARGRQGRRWRVRRPGWVNTAVADFRRRCVCVERPLRVQLRVGNHYFGIAKHTCLKSSFPTAVGNLLPSR